MRGNRKRIGARPSVDVIRFVGRLPPEKSRQSTGRVSWYQAAGAGVVGRPPASTLVESFPNEGQTRVVPGVDPASGPDFGVSSIRRGEVGVEIVKSTRQGFASPGFVVTKEACVRETSAHSGVVGIATGLKYQGRYRHRSQARVMTSQRQFWNERRPYDQEEAIRNDDSNEIT